MRVEKKRPHRRLAARRWTCRPRSQSDSAELAPLPWSRCIPGNVERQETEDGRSGQLAALIDASTPITVQRHLLSGPVPFVSCCSTRP